MPTTSAAPLASTRAGGRSESVAAGSVAADAWRSWRSRSETWSRSKPFDGMMEMIYRDFTYQPGVTDVSTSVAEVVAGGAACVRTSRIC